jgi:hypothetical protein
MNLKKAIFSVNDRFEAVESISNREYFSNYLRGGAKCIAFGGIAGAVVGYLIGGDADSAKTGAFIGSTLDYFQHTLRFFGLRNMNGTQREERKKFYQKWGFM